MRRVLLALVPLLAAAPARGDEHLEIRAAQQDLKLARKYLQAAGRDYEGHRRLALDEVNLALREIREALDETKRGAGGAAPLDADPDLR